MNNNIKQGDFVRLTDPLDNGTIVRIEKVDENGFAEWLGGSQYCDMEQIPCEFVAYPIEKNSLANYYKTLSDVISDLESKIGIKLYPESAVEYWKRREEVEKKEHAYFEQAFEKEHNKLLDISDRCKEWEETADELTIELCKTQKERDKLREYIKRLEAELEEDGDLG